MNKLDDAVREELQRLADEQDQEGIDSVLGVVGPEFAPNKPKTRTAPKTDLVQEVEAPENEKE